MSVEKEKFLTLAPAAMRHIYICVRDVNAKLGEAVKFHDFLLASSIVMGPQANMGRFRTLLGLMKQGGFIKITDGCIHLIKPEDQRPREREAERNIAWLVNCVDENDERALDRFYKMHNVTKEELRRFGVA